MKEILIEVDGKKIKAFVEDDVHKELTQPVKKTGYEVVEDHQKYWTVICTSEVHYNTEVNSSTDRKLSDGANYYSDRTVAENNARADTLMRQLRRFAVKHRDRKLGWGDKAIVNYYIRYIVDRAELIVDDARYIKDLGQVYFDSAEHARMAINKFKDELLWYFTEYKDSL